jgi:hypothetical protein
MGRRPKDWPRLTEDQQALVVAHMGLAVYKARPFVKRARRQSEKDDFVSAAYLGLCKAATRSREIRGAFSTVAGRYAWAECVFLLRRQTRDRVLHFAPEFDLRTDPRPSHEQLIEWRELIARHGRDAGLSLPG